MNKLSVRMLHIVKWDLVLILFCGNFSSIAFYSSFELRTLHFSSGYAVLSFVSCILINVLVAIVLIKTIFIIKHLNPAKSLLRTRRIRTRVIQEHSQADDRQYNSSTESYRFLYKAFKKETLLQTSFMLIFLLRTYISGIVISTLYAHPLLQSIFIFTVSLMVVFYLIVERPLESKLDLLQLILNEIIVLAVNTCVLAFTVMDHVGNHDLNKREVIGSVIITLNMIFSTLALVFLGFQCIKALVVVINGLKALKTKGISSLMQIALFVILGEVGEGKEEESENHQQNSHQNDIKVSDMELNSEKNNSIQHSTTNPNEHQLSMIPESQVSSRVTSDINFHNRLGTVNTNNSPDLKLNNILTETGSIVDRDQNGNRLFTIGSKTHDLSSSFSPFIPQNTSFDVPPIVEEKIIEIPKINEAKQQKSSKADMQTPRNLPKDESTILEQRKKEGESVLTYLSTLDKFRPVRPRQAYQLRHQDK